MESNLPAWGLFWGALSAVSLPLGAVLGLRFRPARKITSGLMAFGGGALLFALTIELFGHVLHVASDAHGHIQQPGFVLVTMAAAVVGGLLFQGLDHLLNSQGGFLRKRALIAKHLSRRKRGEAKRLLNSLSRVHALRSLPPEEVIRLVAQTRRSGFDAGQTVFEQGDEEDRLYFIDSGRVIISRRGDGDGQSTTIATLGPGEIFGEIALVSDTPRTATATVEAKASLLEILKEDFVELVENASGLNHSMLDLARQRIEDLSARHELSDEVAATWQDRALAHFDPGLLRMTPEEVRGEVEEHAERPNAA